MHSRLFGKIIQYAVCTVCLFALSACATGSFSEETPQSSTIQQGNISLSESNKEPQESPFYLDIQGHIYYRERVQLAPNFVCIVLLKDMGERFSNVEPVILDRVIIYGPLTLPLPYAAAMEGYQVNPRHVYTVDAVIFAPENMEKPDMDKGTVLFRSESAVPVLTFGNSARADILMTMRKQKNP